MRQRELADQALQRPRLFRRGQFLSLDVLDERNRDGFFVGELPNDDRDVGEARELRCKPAPLAGDNLVTGSAEVFRAVLLSGGGLALAAPFIAEEELRAGTLVSLLPEYQPVAFAINAIYPHRRYLAATVRTFIDMSVERFVEHQRWMDPP